MTTQLLVGFDGGNGSTKVVFGDKLELRIPAYYHLLSGNIYDVLDLPDGALVEYLDGSRDDLEGSKWLTGSAAWHKAPISIQRVVDDRQGKTSFGLQLLLGAIAVMDYRPTWNITLIASIQDPATFSDTLVRSLEGTHQVKFQDDRSSRVVIKVEKVLEEGVGALIEATALGVLDVKGKQNIVLDLGHGTTIASVFAPGGKLLSRYVHPNGVESLTSALATHIETRKVLSRQGDTELFRQGLENGTFFYGSTGWNFAGIYQQELVSWARENLATTLKSVDDWRDSAASILAVGGGAQLPGIADLLKVKGIKTLDNATMANARGLYRWGTAKLAVGGVR
jgi:Actin like proteins N terminal domain